MGDLVEVRFRNESVSDGATLHWHGVDVPNGEDGVAGVTQDAVMPGEEFVYRFVLEDAGTYWYHSHQVSHEQVRKGLFGTLVVQPRGGVEQDVEAVAVTHTFGVRTLNGREGDVPVVAEPGDTVRLRVVNTDNALVELWADAPYRVLAIDGFDLVGPTEVEDQALTLTAGARADLEVTVPDADAVRVQVGGATSLVVGPDGSTYRRSPGSSTGGPGCGGRSTASCSPTSRCSWSRRATWWSGGWTRSRSLAATRRDRLPRRQSRRVDGPLPQPHSREGRTRGAPDVRRGDDALRGRLGDRQHP